jgi:hypothetical protein
VPVATLKIILTNQRGEWRPLSDLMRRSGLHSDHRLTLFGRMPMANAQNIRSPNQRPGQQIKERYRGCKRVGRDRHARSDPCPNRQHEMSKHASGHPPIPAETGRKYSNYSLAILWLILAGPMASAINNLSALAQKRAEAPRGWAASALTTGGMSGGCLWLAARIAQHRCESEWTHLSLPGRIHSDHRPLW